MLVVSACTVCAVKVAYVVSRFPQVSETFIVRELTQVDGEGIEVILLSLFPPRQPFVHPEAQPWLSRVRRISPIQAGMGCAWWMTRRPSALLRCAFALGWANRRRPSAMIRSLVTVALAAGHARELRGTGVDHIHAHFATYPAIAAWVCAKLMDVTYSITAHAHDLFVDQSYLEIVVADARLVVVISEFNRSFLAPYVAKSHTPVHLVHCGVDPAAYRFRPRAPSAEGAIDALCVASLEEYKGHRVLLEALASGDEDTARLHLRLVGSGPLEHEIRTMVDRLGLGERVQLLGSRSEAEVAAMLEDADLFVLPSIVAHDGQMEGIPVALMEALASGLPAIASRLSGIPELVQDGVTGVLVEPADVAALVGAFRRVCSDPQATRARAQAGRALVEREFNVSRSGEQMRALFLALVPATPAGRPRERSLQHGVR
jgi:colanic acid/amylovoran biosynthesis glycosyltransferase